MREYGAEAKNIEQRVHGGVDTGHTLKKVLEIVQVPESVDLVELLQDEELVLNNIHGEERFEYAVERKQKVQNIPILEVLFHGSIRLDQVLHIVNDELNFILNLQHLKCR